VHDDWVAYNVGIDVDDEYKVVAFRADDRFKGITLFHHASCPQNHVPADALLRDYFRQCLLANVRGAGERDGEELEHGPDEGDEDLGREKWSKPTIGGNSWVEIELANRLSGFQRME